VLSAQRVTAWRRADDGSIMVLIIGYTAIAAVLITVGVDVSKVFLAQRALASAADSAALAAAQGVNTQEVYDGAGPQCGQPLPLDRARAAALAAGSVASDREDLDHSFASVADPQTSIDGGTASVRLSGQVSVPFGQVLSWLDPSNSNGEVTVTETSHAQSPVAAGGC
jgi:type II secretory pathway component PulM